MLSCSQSPVVKCLSIVFIERATALKLISKVFAISYDVLLLNSNLLCKGNSKHDANVSASYSSLEYVGDYQIHYLTFSLYGSKLHAHIHELKKILCVYLCFKEL